MDVTRSVELLAPAVVVFLANQLTKMLVVRLLGRGQTVCLTSFVQICFTTNICRNRRFVNSRVALLLLWGSTLVTLILVTEQGSFFGHAAAQMGLEAALGGAASNLHDWRRHGSVIDLVRVGWWPVFNLADVGITLGAITALWFIR